MRVHLTTLSLTFVYKESQILEEEEEEERAPCCSSVGLFSSVDLTGSLFSRLKHTFAHTSTEYEL